MARRAFGCNLGGSLFIPTASGANAIVPTATEAAVAVLEADGASPTQAHVTSLRAAWNPMSAASTANHVTLQFDDSVVTNQNALLAAIAALLKAVQATNFPQG
jgi:hypothetical protein